MRPGGSILYATCSSEPEENEDVVSRFLERSSAFVRRPIDLPSAREVVTHEGYVRTLPFRDGLEAFFAASLMKAPDLR